jgi:hypothetical protein
MLRTGPAKHDETQAAEVLLVRRAKAPEIGKWTVPGGSLELGEEAGLSCEANIMHVQVLDSSCGCIAPHSPVAHQLFWRSVWT